MTFTEPRTTINLSVTVYYARALGSPPKLIWGGKHGTIAHICEVFHLPKSHRRRIRRVLKNFNESKHKNIPFDGRDKRECNTGRPTLIQPGSSDEGLITDLMENNMGFIQTTVMLNEHHRGQGKHPVGRNAVMSAFDRMNPKIDRVQKVVQGGSSEEW